MHERRYMPNTRYGNGACVMKSTRMPAMARRHAAQKPRRFGERHPAAQLLAGGGKDSTGVNAAPRPDGRPIEHGYSAYEKAAPSYGI